tara:strand:+ start:5041 stop:7017 length:1977 start_codon:yes stop_codon:yes gene_type:complete
MAGYSRTDTTNNIADGNIINASDFDGEFDAIATAFGTSGHTHDGTSENGGAITKIGPAQDLVVSASLVTPKTTGTLDIGTDSLEFKDIYIDGIAYIDGLGRDILVATDKKIQFRDDAIFINSSTDGQLDIDADTTIQITAPTVDIDASTKVDISTDLVVGDDLTLASDSAILGFGADTDTTLTHTDGTGLTLNSTNKLTFGDATSFVHQSSDGVLTIDGEATIDLNASTAVTVSNDLKLDSDGAVLGFGTDNDVTVTHVADTGLRFEDSDKLMFGAGSDLQIYHDGSNSYIDDADAGGLIIRGSAITLKKYSGDEPMASFTADGASIIYHDNTARITTTAAGIETSGNLTVGADLIVNGTTTTVNSTTVTIDDPIFTLGGDTAPGSDDNKDRGIEFRYHTGSTAKIGFFGFDDSAGKFTFIPDATNTSEVFSGTAGTIVANVEGNVTGDLTGNVSGATTVTGTTLIGKLKKTASDTEFTLPASDGSAGQFLKTDASGNLGFASATQTTINNNADNRIITGSGTANELEGEANLTYNGTTLSIGGTITSVTNITASGTIQGAEVTATSDERLKSDIQTIDNALDKVMNMRGVTYTMQAEKGTGVIAQEVEKVLPEVVVDNEYKSVAYGNMVGVLIEAIKELKTEIDTHKQGCKCHAPSK